MPTELIKQYADKIYPEIVKIRRELHMHPELAFEERFSNRLICKYLKEWGIPFESGMANTGVVGLIEGGERGSTVALRADMDALPVEELNDVPYKSLISGKMHACGHDAHTSWLLGAAYILNAVRDKLKGNIKLIFQPAEEGAGGAQPMIKAGVMDNPKVDFCLGAHVTEELEAGNIYLKDGPVMASPDDFDIIIKGKGGHAAHPDSCIDPVIIGCHVVNALQSIVTRNISPTSPAVISICAFNAGSAHNVIPSTAHLMGTARSVDPATREKLRTLIESTASGIVSAMGAEMDFKYTYLYPPTINSPEINRYVAAAAGKTLGEGRVVYGTEPSMGGEDFAYFCQIVPSAYFKVGIANKQRGIIHPTHSPHFDIDESALKVGMLVLSQAAADLAALEPKQS